MNTNWNAVTGLFPRVSVGLLGKTLGFVFIRVHSWFQLPFYDFNDSTIQRATTQRS